MIPAVSEAARIAILELFIMCWSVNASSVMNIDIVKPIPPKKPTPIMSCHVRFFGNTQSPTLTPSKENNAINPLSQLSAIGIHVLAIANSVSTNKDNWLFKNRFKNKRWRFFANRTKRYGECQQHSCDGRMHTALCHKIPPQWFWMLSILNPKWSTMLCPWLSSKMRNFRWNRHTILWGQYKVSIQQMFYIL